MQTDLIRYQGLDNLLVFQSLVFAFVCFIVLYLLTILILFLYSWLNVTSQSLLSIYREA